MVRRQSGKCWTGRRLALGTAVVLFGWLVLFAGVDPAEALPGPVCAAGTCTVSYAETGAPQPFTVPAGIGSITVVVAGGSGGTATAFSGSPSPSGTGGKVTATVGVTAGDQLSIVVGAAGADGGSNTSVVAAGGYGGGGSAGSMTATPSHPGAGGGGGSFVFDTSGTPRLLAAAGGGGGSGCYVGANSRAGGAGGAGGDAGTTPPGDPDFGISSGAGATLGGPGVGGAAGSNGGSTGFSGAATVASNDTTLGVGGAGATNPNGQTPYCTASGGGGGYYGGGGGGSDGPGGYVAAGGGGSGFLAAGATGVATATNTGDGSVVISYLQPVATVTTLGVSPTGAITAGTHSHLTATVASDPAGSTPTGTVTFTEGTTTLGTAPLVSGVASLSVTLPVGAHAITAGYSGGGAFLTSTTAAAVHVTVDPVAVQPLAATGPATMQLTSLGFALAALGCAFLAVARRRAGCHGLGR